MLHAICWYAGKEFGCHLCPKNLPDAEQKYIQLWLCMGGWNEDLCKFKASLVLHSKVQANQGSVVTLYEDKNNNELISSVHEIWRQYNAKSRHSYYWLLFILVYNEKHQVEQEKWKMYSLKRIGTLGNNIIAMNVLEKGPVLEISPLRTLPCSALEQWEKYPQVKTPFSWLPTLLQERA